MEHRSHSRRNYFPVLLHCVMLLAAVNGQAQNSYPAAGNALINGLTVGSAPGTGSYNTAFGVNALSLNTSAGGNTAIGYLSLAANNGFSNTANGAFALQVNTTGYFNTGNGYATLYYNTTGSYNTANGVYSLYSNTGGYNNAATGFAALFSNTYGFWNTANGYQSLYSNAVGYGNTANGYQALYFNVAYSNSATGYHALYNNTSGSDNAANGYGALLANTTGSENTADGFEALSSNTTGNYNTAIGEGALSDVTTGSYNTGIGTLAGVNTGSASNSTCLGYFANMSASNQVRIGNAAITSIGGYVGWSNVSDARVKKNIKANVPGLAFINQLQPITYNLDLEAADRIIAAPAPKTSDGKAMPVSAEYQAARQAKEQIVYTGFKAQDVETAAKSIGYDFSGIDPAKNSKDLYALRYSDFVVPLVKAVQELSNKNDSLVAANAQLNERLTNLEQLMGVNSNNVNGAAVSLSSARLYQNTPNPFNQSTLINYYVPQGAGAAIIQITNTQGQTIKTFSIASAGNGQLSVATAQLAAGTYAYSLIVAGNVIDSKTMVLVR